MPHRVLSKTERENRRTGESSSGNDDFLGGEVRDLSELDEMNRLLIARYQEYEDRDADLEDDENSRSSRERRR